MSVPFQQWNRVYPRTSKTQSERPYFFNGQSLKRYPIGFPRFGRVLKSIFDDHLKKLFSRNAHTSCPVGIAKRVLFATRRTRTMWEMIPEASARFHRSCSFPVEVEPNVSTRLTVLRSNILLKFLLEEVSCSTTVALVWVGHSRVGTSPRKKTPSRFFTLRIGGISMTFTCERRI